MATTSLRDRQIASVTQMLNLNEGKSITGGGNAPTEPVWKILIYDRVGMEILTPLFTVQELRQNGITLHIPLHSAERIASSIPDVPAIYFCLPTEDNIDRISRDIQSNLYGNYYLNFLRPIPRSRIEDLATAVLNAPEADNKCISKVYDQYLDFVSLENELFVLNCKQGLPDFYGLNRSNLNDNEMNEMLDSIVDSLFSVCVTYGQVPVIRTPKSNNAAEIIGEKLDKKIRDNIKDPRSSLFNNQSQMMSSDFSGQQNQQQRPLLLIYDRGMDLSTGLAHAWTYQSLTHDILENSQNQIKFTEESAQKIFSVDTRRDGFWRTYKGCPFPTVAEAIQNELEDYRKSEEEVKKLKSTMGLSELNEQQQNLMDFDVEDNTLKLTNAIKDLPLLIERKRVLDAHTSIATGILGEIKSRHLDTFYEVESKLLAKSSDSSSVSINNILLDSQLGKFEDKMRLYLIYYLANNANVSNSELDQFAASLAGVSEGSEHETLLLKSILFVKKWISYSKMVIPTPMMPSSYSSALTSSARQSSMLTKLVNTGSTFLMEGVRNLVFKRQTLPVTRLALDMCEGRSDPEAYRHFDPKQMHHQQQSQTKARQATYNDCIVFVVGGGNYVEYQNLLDCFNTNTNNNSSNNLAALNSQPQQQAAAGRRRVTYGATALYNGEEFLHQLALLGNN